MAIILYCRNGHNLSTHDPIFLHRPTMRQVIAMAEQVKRDAVAPRSPFCAKCGAPTLDACEHCRVPIQRGGQPAYCGNCGRPFPWTESALKAAKELADELEELSTAERATLKAAIDDLTLDTPRTEPAAHRFLKMLRKVGPDAAEVIRKTVVEIASSTAVKLLKG